MTNKEKKPNKVYDSIKEAILYMKIKPGESIGEIPFNISFSFTFPQSKIGIGTDSLIVIAVIV